MPWESQRTRFWVMGLKKVVMQNKPKFATWEAVLSQLMLSGLAVARPGEYVPFRKLRNFMAKVHSDKPFPMIFLFIKLSKPHSWSP
jgi:hypothetical protein